LSKILKNNRASNKIIIVTNKGDNISVSIKIRAVNKPIIRTIPGSPSLYKTNTNEKYTNAEPVSFCNKIRAAGVNNINDTSVRFLILSSLKLNRLSSLAIARFVANLANSAGCNLKPPISNHERAPFTSLPNSRTNISMRIVKIYIGYEKNMKNLLSIINIVVIRIIEAIIHNNCFP
jgi:hypothetical protein